MKLFSDPAGISQREIHPQLTGAAGAKRAKDSLSLAPKLGRIAWQTIIAIIRCVDKFGVVGKNHAEFNPEGGTVLQLKQLPSLLGHCTSVSEPSRKLGSGFAEWCMAMRDVDGDSIPRCEQKYTFCTVVHHLSPPVTYRRRSFGTESRRPSARDLHSRRRWR